MKNEPQRDPDDMPPDEVDGRRQAREEMVENQDSLLDLFLEDVAEEAEREDRAESTPWEDPDIPMEKEEWEKD